MDQQNPIRRQVDKFILQEIDSVPHLEALLLLWNSHPRAWAVAEMALALYISNDSTQSILNNLKSRGLVMGHDTRYAYNPESREHQLMKSVAEIYGRELVRVSRMIHSKASPSVREFARAFRLKEE